MENSKKEFLFCVVRRGLGVGMLRSACVPGFQVKAVKRCNLSSILCRIPDLLNFLPMPTIEIAVLIVGVHLSFKASVTPAPEAKK